MCNAAQLSSEKVIYTFSPTHPPAVEVDSGATLVVETLNTYERGHDGRHHTASIRPFESSAGNPATGPVFVRGLSPGDGLDVTIERVVVAPEGYVFARPGIGVLGDLGVEPGLHAFQVEEDRVLYDHRIRLPLRPMIGTIGVAPAEGEIRTLDLGYHGGNLDCNAVAAGTTIHFPVFAPGGLLALGDAHATMGDGEVYSGVNIDAEVTLSVRRVPAAGWTRPWFETATEAMTLGVEDRIEEAIREATLGMTELLQERLGLTFTQAVVLTGAAVDVRLGQASKYGTKVSAYACFPVISLRTNGSAMKTRRHKEAPG